MVKKQEKWLTLRLGRSHRWDIKSDRPTKCTDSSRLGFQHTSLSFGLAKDSFAFWEPLLFKLRATFFFLCTESAKITYLFGHSHPSLGKSGASAFMRKQQLTAIKRRHFTRGARIMKLICYSL